MSRTNRPPNIVLVLLDQLRADVCGTYGSAICRTPHLDRIAAQGIRFDRAYTPIGICSPARASMLSGTYPHRHGVLNNVHGPDALQVDLRPGTPVYPALLRDAGYATSYTGKWHVDIEDGPASKGFTHVGACDDYMPALAEQRRRLGLPHTDPIAFDRSTTYPPLSARATRTVPGFPLEGRETQPVEGTPQGLFLENALDAMEAMRRGDAPFLLVLSFLGPHWPYSVPEPWWSMYDPAAIPPWPNWEDDFTGKPGANRRGLQHFGVEGWTWQDWAPTVAAYLGSVTMHDELIGRLVAALDAGGAAEDTLLIVTADHGDLCGSHRQFNKGPLMYEEVYRIPLVARWPGVIAPQSASDAYASSLDLFATMLDAAGVALPDAPLDSRSLLPLLRGETPQGWRDSWVSEFHGDEFGLYSQRMLVHGRHKLVYNPHDVDELYDLVADPHELRNLSAEPSLAALRDDLESRLAQWMDATGDPLGKYAYNLLG
ncbi:MAG TPA: sulfatase-like hydrolase/transferase [Candidatus Dormibacteraeota bacterium]|nr:sulfatase-like hydrolase/transferase [Candidatus Dormibacteraeota bacterium]